MRLALLAVLAAAGGRGVSRDRLIGLFWPDSDENRARHSLRQLLYGLRHDLDGEVIDAAGPALSLAAGLMTSDAGDFQRAVAAGDRAKAAELARQPFLDGFYLPGAPEFERWAEEERARFAAAATTALLSLATEASRLNDHDAAVEWWRQLTVREPVSGRCALGYLRALAARGDRGEALAFARRHEALVRRELEVDADDGIRQLEAELRALAAPVPRAAKASGAPPPPWTATADVATQSSGPVRRRRLRTSPMVLRAGVVAALVVTLLTLIGWRSGWFSARSPAAVPALAVGLLHEEGVTDSLRLRGVLTDMLATSLARVEGLAVLANTRLLELMQPGREATAAGYADAARRAGAAELLEGSLRAAPSGVTLELRRVDLRTGLVRRVYRVTAADRYALVDSVTRSIARDLNHDPPRGSIAQATTPSPVAYRLYEEGLRAYYSADLSAAQRLMRAALEEDSTFAMAAYYESTMAAGGGEYLPDGSRASAARQRALRLASHAPDRERLTIIADLLSRDLEPRALAVAESLTARYPDDPRALATLGAARVFAGDWPRAVNAFERAVELDSAAEPAGRPICRLCDDFMQLAGVYFWWDSLPAVERTARRFLRARPSSPQPDLLLAMSASRKGDENAVREHFRRLAVVGPHPPDLVYSLRLDLGLEAYNRVERDIRPLLASPRADDFNSARWLLLIALRNQGRLREATELMHTGRLAGFTVAYGDGRGDDLLDALLALERGEAREAAAIYARRRHMDTSQWASGLQARYLAWAATLHGMALAASGDWPAVRDLADTVQYWGQRSGYGRDRKAHHYLRGLLLASTGRHDEAVREYRAAIHSPSLGFTRVNYELARSLLRLGRPQEAITTLQPALRGEIDASNLYITRTDFHELLAQSFNQAGQRDSATAHYRAVVRAWERADPQFQARRERAARWLAGN